MIRRGLLVCLLLGVLPGMSQVRAAEAEKEKFKWGDFLPNGLQQNPRINITANTVMTEEGRKLPPPSGSSPAYYTIVDGGRVEEGDAVRGDMWPAAPELARLLGASLARGGYLPADPGHPPAVVIHYRWGILNRLHGASLPDLDNPHQLRNFMARAIFVGGEKFALDLRRVIHTRSLDAFRRQSWQTDDLVSLLSSDLYVILASGYDYAALQHGEKILLWKTRIATDSQGLVLRDTLPSLVLNAGSYIGHETPTVMLRRRLMSGRVDIGELIFEEYMGERPVPADGRK